MNSCRSDRIGHKNVIRLHCSWAHFNVSSICIAEKHKNDLSLFPKAVQVLRGVEEFKPS